MNAELGRKVLDFVTAHRKQFDMEDFGYQDPTCGTTGCLAGWAMLLRGYRLTGLNFFERPDGAVVHAADEEAARLLELEPGQGRDLFYIEDNDEAIERFRELVEAAEAGEPS